MSNRMSLWWALIVIFVVAGIALAAAGTIFMIARGADAERDLQLVVSDISVDITAQRVYARDFVRSIHTGTYTTTRVGGVKLEWLPMWSDDPYWETEHPFGCEELGVNEAWVRILDDGNGNSKAPTLAYLTISDSEGQCGEPQFNPGPNEEEDDE